MIVVTIISVVVVVALGILKKYKQRNEDEVA